MKCYITQKIFKIWIEYITYWMKNIHMWRISFDYIRFSLNFLSSLAFVTTTDILLVNSIGDNIFTSLATLARLELVDFQATVLDPSLYLRQPFTLCVRQWFSTARNYMNLQPLLQADWLEWTITVNSSYRQIFPGLDFCQRFIQCFLDFDLSGHLF